MRKSEAEEKKTIKDEKTKESSISKLPELFYTTLYEYTFPKTITSQKTVWFLATLM
jgi:hypothetical protein